MMMTLIAAALLATAPIAAQIPPAPTGPAAETAAPAHAAQEEPVTVRLETSLGAIVIALDPVHAPVTTANFLRYVDQNRLAGTGFYRAMQVGEGYGLIQAGTRNEPKRTLPPIAHEPTSQTGLKHLDGTISMARYAPGSAAGDFFIAVGDLPSLDANPGAEGDNLGFAAFGRVVEGMDVVKRILAAPTSPTEGEGVMRGQMIAEPVKILAATRTKKTPER